MDAVHAGAVLGVAGRTSPAVLRRAYRERLKSVHPDTGSGDVISLTEVRAAYRALQPQAVAPAQPAAPYGERPPEPGTLIDVYA